VLAWPDGHEESFAGRVEGRVVWPPRGALGHGYDPVFVPEGETRTFAEMTAEEKNRLSHRGRSIRAFEAACLG
jgi:XTP/dITP diphosphohydrolase